MKSIFNEDQLKAIDLLSQGGKTYKEIAELCDTTAETLRQWRKNSEFQDEVRKACKELLRDMEPTLYNLAYQRALESGSWQHIKLLLERIERLEDIADGRGQDYSIMFKWKEKE